MTTDFKYDSTGDLDVMNGDLVISMSDEQHVEDLLKAEKGHYKQSPVTGIGIINYLDAPMSLVKRDALKRQIKLQCEVDGMRMESLTVTEDATVKIKGEYT